MEHQTGPEGPAGPEEAERAPEPESPAIGEAPATSEPSATGEAPATGEPRVDAALRLLDRLPSLPVGEHAELYEQVHGELSDVLGELDSGTTGPAGD